MTEDKMGFLCCIGWEPALIEEITRLAPGTEPQTLAPGLVVCHDFPGRRTWESVFARQWLPDCTEINGHSISDFVAQIAVLVDPILDNTGLPWTVHFGTPDHYTLDSDRYQSLYSRANLLQEKFLERMKTYRKRAMTRFFDFTGGDDKRNSVIIQGLMTRKNQVWGSVSERIRMNPRLQVPLLWRGNPGNVPPAPAAPCRSYYKIEEAWRFSGICPTKGCLCIDLGAAPGGWTWAALQRGARVTAVDSADLAGPVADHPNCTHSRDNGYEFMPDKTVDWMFCDMIVRPMAALGLLDRWLSAGACRHFVMNVKFRGLGIGGILTRIDELASQHAVKNLSVRHLFFDRSEITLIGTVP
jgi:23S rRNA (cytidine2498-2'-O)-methyltransferase